MSYTRINWKNYPETDTPISADNLNVMDKGISDLNTSLTSLDETTLKHSKNATVGNTYTPVYVPSSDGTVATCSVGTTLDDVTGGTTKIATTTAVNAAYSDLNTNKVSRLSTSVSTGSATVPVYVDENGTVETCTTGADYTSSTETGLFTVTGAYNMYSDITSSLNNKASNSSVTALSNTVDTKADSSTVTALSSTVSALSDTVATKADTSTVSALSTTVSNLSTTVSTKADSSTVSALSTTVSNKADSSTVSALSTTVSGLSDDIETLEDTVSGKRNMNEASTLNASTTCALPVYYPGQLILITTYGGSTNALYAYVALPGTSNYGIKKLCGDDVSVSFTVATNSVKITNNNTTPISVVVI